MCACKKRSRRLLRDVFCATACFGISRCLFAAACVHFFLVLGAPMGLRPLLDVEAPLRCSVCARLFVSGAADGPRLLEVLQVPLLRRVRARPRAPGIPIGPRSLKDVDLPVLGGYHAHPRLPGEPLDPRALQDLEVPAGCSVSAESGFELLARLSLFLPRTYSTSLARAMLATASATFVRVPFPGGRCSSPAAGGTSWRRWRGRCP